MADAEAALATWRRVREICCCGCKLGAGLELRAGLDCAMIPAVMWACPLGRENVILSFWFLETSTLCTCQHFSLILVLCNVSITRAKMDC